MKINKHLLIDLLLVAAMGGIALLGYWYSDALIPKADLTLPLAEGCDLHRAPCAIPLSEGRVIELSILPHPIPTVRPLTIEVVTKGLDPRRIEVDFAGVGMNMGINRVRLDAKGQGRFSGQATLPVCVTGSMTWEATVLVETASQRIAAPFRFDSVSQP